MPVHWLAQNLPSCRVYSCLISEDTTEQFIFMPQYQVELVWNREFHFVTHGAPHATIEAAITYAKSMENIGDGASVKKTQVVDEDGKVVWAFGKRVKS